MSKRSRTAACPATGDPPTEAEALMSISGQNREAAEVVLKLWLVVRGPMIAGLRIQQQCVGGDEFDKMARLGRGDGSDPSAGQIVSIPPRYGEGLRPADLEEAGGVGALFGEALQRLEREVLQPQGLGIPKQPLANVIIVREDADGNRRVITSSVGRLDIHRG